MPSLHKCNHRDTHIHEVTSPAIKGTSLARKRFWQRQGEVIILFVGLCRRRLLAYTHWDKSLASSCLVYWYDSRSGCERSRVQFPEQPLVHSRGCTLWKFLRKALPRKDAWGFMQVGQLASCQTRALQAGAQVIPNRNGDPHSRHA